MTTTTSPSPPPSTPAPTPIQIHIPPTLSKYVLPLALFTSTHPTHTAFAIGAFIFRNHHHHITDHLLLLQRTPSSCFASKWEIPGGGPETTDPTILHSLAREVFEETGLRLVRFVREVGQGQKFGLGNGGVCLKFCFEIEVVEIHGEGGGRGRGDGDGDGDGDGLGGGKGPEGDMEIRLDPEEHQAFVWASRDDVLGDRYAVVSEEQKGLMLEAFEVRRAEREWVKTTADRAGGKA